MLTPNRFGKVKKADAEKAGFEIVEIGFTYSEIKEAYGIELDWNQRLKYCIGFRCEKAWRGCVPVFDILDTYMRLYEDGLIE